ncbi:MAG: SprT family zinc-dependent metalloprotease [Pseudomonadota bacterium]
MADAPIHLAGEPPVTVAVRRAARARRMSLRVSRLDGRITLTLPTWAPRREAEAFVQEKAGWLRARLSEQTDKVQITWGAEVPVEGVLMKVVAGRRTRLVPDEAMIAIASGTRSVPAAVAGVLKSHARDRLTTSSDRYSAALGRPYARITLRDTRSRWGSCSSRGALMYSWRLILAPPDVLDYVAAHEVAHLAQMNHSPAFWAEVAALCPNYAAPRAWLRRHGEDLHRYRFSG